MAGDVVMFSFEPTGRALPYNEGAPRNWLRRPKAALEQNVSILEFFGSLFDSSSPSLSDSSSLSDHASSVGSSGCDWSPSVNNAFGTAAGEFQCASEASSLYPEFSCTQSTWGSIDS